MSKRVKFALITWIGENVGGLQRAKTGTDKSLVKDIVQVSAGRGNVNQSELRMVMGLTLKPIRSVLLLKFKTSCNFLGQRWFSAARSSHRCGIWRPQRDNA